MKGRDRETVLMVIEAPGGAAPTMEAAAARLGLPIAAVDREFGVIAVDPDKGLFTVRVFADAIPAGHRWCDGKTSGPYADVVIEPFGLPKR